MLDLERLPRRRDDGYALEEEHRGPGSVVSKTPADAGKTYETTNPGPRCDRRSRVAGPREHGGRRPEEKR